MIFFQVVLQIGSQFQTGVVWPTGKTHRSTGKQQGIGTRFMKKICLVIIKSRLDVSNSGADGCILSDYSRSERLLHVARHALTLAQHTSRRDLYDAGEGSLNDLQLEHDQLYTRKLEYGGSTDSRSSSQRKHNKVGQRIHTIF